MIKVCCVCNRVEQGEAWVAHYAFGPDESVTHGYCPVCFTRVMAEITAYVSHKKEVVRVVKQQPELRAYIPACA